MQRTRLIGAATIASALVLVSAGCNKNRQTTPDLQTSTGVQPRAQAVTVTGCLRNGTMAENTWVLFDESAAAKGNSDVPTYQLMGGDPAALRQNVGHQVEVSGTVEAEQKVASSGETQESRAKGTSGTPTVETKTDVDIRRMDINSLKPTGNSCRQ